MSSWLVPGSRIRYYQCPFCSRTHSSLYGEVFRARAGVRRLDAAEHPADSRALPVASPANIRWTGVRTAAARWFARLEAEELHHAARASRTDRVAQASPATAGGAPSPSRPASALALAARPARHR
jgi:hypothetical protein